MKFIKRILQKIKRGILLIFKMIGKGFKFIFKMIVKLLRFNLKVLKIALFYGFIGAALVVGGYYSSQFIKHKIQQDINHDMLYSHVTVKGNKSLGSGVVIKSDEQDSYILTNNHVCLSNKTKHNLIEYEPFVIIEVYSGRTYTGQPIKVGKNVDLCLIHIHNVELPWVKLADKDQEYSDVIYNISSPLGFGGFMTRGYVGRFTYIKGTLFRHSTVVIYPGSSGSGVFNEDGELVGLIARGGRPGFSFHVPLSHVKHFLGDLEL